MLLGRVLHRKPVQPEHSIIVSQSAAKQLWPGRNPIGRSLRLGATDEQFTIGPNFVQTDFRLPGVGIAHDTRGADL